MNLSLTNRFEGSVFFIYDHNVLKKEEDLLEDAILYFYPHSMPIDSQCLLCGQLMGLVQFSNEMFGSSPILYRFKKEKIAIKHVGQYSFAFAGSNIDPDSMLIDQLDRLYYLFSFYHGSVDQVKLDCNNDQKLFLSEMRLLWEQYLAFIRNSGDQLPSVFNPISYLPAKDAQNHSFLKASYILQACQRRPHVIAGCILYNRFILCSQLTESISRCLLLLKPNQHHHPAIPIETNFDLPYGVRLFSVYVNKNDLDNLLEDNSNSPYNISQETTEGYKCCCEMKRTITRLQYPNVRRRTAHDSGRHSTPMSEPDPISSSSSRESSTTLCKDILEELILKGFKCCKCQDEIEGEFDEGSICASDSDKKSRVIHNVRKVSRESLCDENEVVFHRIDAEKEDVIDERATYSRHSIGTLEDESGIEVTCSDWCSSVATPFEQTSGRVNEVYGEKLAQEIERNSKQPRGIDRTSVSSHFESNFEGFNSTSTDFQHTNDHDGQLVQKVTEETKDSLGIVGHNEHDIHGSTGTPFDPVIDPEAVYDVEAVGENYKGFAEDETSVSSVLEGKPEIDVSKTTTLEDIKENVIDVDGEPLLKTERQKTKECCGIVKDGILTDNEDNQEVCDSVITPFEHTDKHLTDVYNEHESQSFRDKTKSSHCIVSAVEIKESVVPEVYDQTEQRGKEDKNTKIEGISDSQNEQFDHENEQDKLGTHGFNGIHSGNRGETLTSSVDDVSHFEDSRVSMRTSRDNLERKRIIDHEVDAMRPCGSNTSSQEIPRDREGYSSEGRKQCSGIDGSGLLGEDVGEKQDHGLLKDDSVGGGKPSDDISEVSEDMNDEKNEDLNNDHENSPKGHEVDGFVHANLFVQAHSEIVLILLTNCDLHQKEDVIKSLWNASLSQLGELDVLLRKSSKSTKETTQDSYNYFIYDNFEKTMSGNVKEPVYSGDIVFCDTAKSLHDHFKNSPELVDVTLRNFHTGIYGRRTLSKEVYFQEPMISSVTSQRPQPQDLSSYLEKKVRSCLLKDHGIHLV